MLTVDQVGAFRALLPGCLVSLPGRWDHFPMVEDPEAYATEIVALARKLTVDVTPSFKELGRNSWSATRKRLDHVCRKAFNVADRRFDARFGSGAGARVPRPRYGRGGAARRGVEDPDRGEEARRTA